MAATKLAVFNNALHLLEERRLSSLTEARKPRYELDAIWEDDFIDECLEEGLWNFAACTVKAEYDPSYAPDNGHRYVYGLPTDFIKLAAIASDEYLDHPLTRYRIENGLIYCDLQEIYMTYISNGTTYGSDLSLWTKSFQRFVEARLALRAGPSISGSDAKIEKLERLEKKRLINARSKDAMQEPPKFFPQGSWVRARLGRASLPYDRGGRG